MAEPAEPIKYTLIFASPLGKLIEALEDAINTRLVLTNQIRFRLFDTLEREADTQLFKRGMSGVHVGHITEKQDDGSSRNIVSWDRIPSFVDSILLTYKQYQMVAMTPVACDATDAPDGNGWNLMFRFRGKCEAPK
jgi:hypothetical protein